MTSIVLNGGDSHLVGMAARLLVAQQPGKTRVDKMDRLAGCYRDDLAEAHPGVDAVTLEDMTVNFIGALMREMERWADEKAEGDEPRAWELRGASLPKRPRVVAAIGQMLEAIDPCH
jgi:hypothetical protein